MRIFNFNYCIPREFKDQVTKEIHFCLPKGGEKMEVGDLCDIHKTINSDTPKEKCPWLQVFQNGYRVTNDNIDWSEWNGVTFSDIDSKHFYNNEHSFNVDKYIKMIFTAGSNEYRDNYICAQVTSSGKSFRIMWYWDCERTEENFTKCAYLTERYTREMFYSFGSEGKQIIDYKYKNRRVLDHCSASIKQGMYLTNNELWMNLYFDDNFGYCDLNEINIEDIYKTKTIKTYGNFEQSKYVKMISKETVTDENKRYYPHQHRRCIYEALIVLFKDKETVDNEWNNVCKYITEENGHTTSFYSNEPNKNKWYERFNKNVFHNLSWLKNFGYKYSDKTEYIYIDNFIKCWKQHIEQKALELVFNEEIQNIVESRDKRTSEENARIQAIMRVKEEHKDFDLFDPSYDDVQGIGELRNQYYNRKWQPSDFKYLVSNYQLPNDIVTYKMYADFYYRDNNNLPTLSYDILQDDVLVNSYWFETGKVQDHPLKFNDEFTHWKNSDTFSNKANKTDMTDALKKFTPRWFSKHLIKDYLNSLDLSTANEELLETWAIRYFNEQDSPLTRKICKNFFIAAVKKQMIEDAGQFVFPHILLIQGPTGCGKTYFISTMFTVDNHSLILNKIDPNGKDNEIGPLIARNWCIQFGESASLKKVDANTQKEFVDRINMGLKYQKKFENEQTTIYPRVVMCRTSNDDVLFNDVSINEVDRRNWMIVCKVEANCCDKAMRDRINAEKDILWATAYKLYLDDPDQDLELSQDENLELNKIQEEFKLIKNDDVQELYDHIFDRVYATNSHGEIMDEHSFTEQVSVSDFNLYKNSNMISKENSANTREFLDYTHDEYDILAKITKIPVKWLSNYIKKEYGINMWKLLKDKMNSSKWVNKNVRYGHNVQKCWVW